MKKFIRLPVIFQDVEEKDLAECEECEEKASLMGVPVEKMCPECGKKSPVKEEHSFESIDVSDILAFSPMGEDAVSISFKSSVYRASLRYEISEIELVEKLRKAGVEIIL